VKEINGSQGKSLGEAPVGVHWKVKRKCVSDIYHILYISASRIEIENGWSGVARVSDWGQAGERQGLGGD